MPPKGILKHEACMLDWNFQWIFVRDKEKRALLFFEGEGDSLKRWKDKVLKYDSDGGTLRNVREQMKEK